VSEDAAQAATRVPVLEARAISKRFGAVQALSDVSLVLHAGEVLGLVGDNGAGKSTLIHILSGTIRPDDGGISVDGVDHTFDHASQAREAGIETVFQFLSLIPTLDIAENIFLQREQFGPGRVRRAMRWMDKAGMRRQVAEGLAKLGLVLPSPKTKVAALSGGQRQAVAIGRAVLWGSHIVLMDEPVAALGVRQTEIVLSFVERLKAHGIAVVFITHNMQHVLRVADRIIVLRLGKKVFDGAASAVTGSDLVSLITGAQFEVGA
jgi:ABC-type sugar transport system ATPase subunit